MQYGAGGEWVDLKCPYGKPGDHLWVKETWSNINDFVLYRAAAEADDSCDDLFIPGKTAWRSPRFMPRWASRITLEITGVRVERIQDIGLVDLVAEGVDEKLPDGHSMSIEQLRNKYRALWDSLNAKRGFGWDSNPWVWCISLKRIRP
jgi:hypothetical protein